MKDKIRTQESLAQIVLELAAEGKKVVFTNGCFDILHVGHTRYLQAARALGDCLVVAVNSDRSVRSLKGDKRPLIRENERAELLAALDAVDFVTIFDEEEPLNVIRKIRPHFLVKGGDWGDDEIIGSDFVKSIGGDVLCIPYIEGASTSSIVEEIIERYCRG